MKSIFLRAALGATLSLAMGLSLNVSADDQMVDRTELELRLANGNIEKLAFDSFTADGQRTLTTAAGNVAILTQSAGKLKIETGGEVFEVSTPDPEIQMALAHAETENLADWTSGDGKKRKIVIKTDEDSTDAEGNVQSKKIVMIQRHSDTPGELDNIEIDDVDVIDLDDDTLPEGKRIKMMRKIEHRKTEVTQ